MSKPKYTVVISLTGEFKIKHLNEVAFLKAKGTSSVKATRLLQELQDA